MHQCISTIWDNPSLWWESDKVKNVLSETFDKIGNPFNINWIGKWKEELDKYNVRFYWIY